MPLVLGDKTVPAGEYSLFVDLKLPAWTLIVSSWAAQERFDANNKDALWGAYGYTADKDVVRVPMKLETLPFDRGSADVDVPRHEERQRSHRADVGQDAGQHAVQGRCARGNNLAMRSPHLVSSLVGSVGESALHTG